MTGLVSTAAQGIKGVAKVPGDKSISHRSLMLGAIAGGTTTVHGLLEGEDVLRTAKAMIAMGVIIAPPDREGGIWTINGMGAQPLRQPRASLYLGNSGTSARLLMGLVAGYPVTATFTGDASLQKRPMGRAIKPLAQMGAWFEATSGDRLPLRVTGMRALRAIEYTLPVASAQVKSAILLAALHAEGTTTVIEPQATRDHSERMLRHFGADVETEPHGAGGAVIRLTGFPTLTGGVIHVPSDPSSAAFIAVAALITPDSEVLIPNVSRNPLRTGLYDTLLDMGADITFENPRDSSGEPVADIRVRSSRLTGVRVPASRVPSMIDEFPILSVAAAFAQGKTEMTDLSELRVKESDRLSAIATGLAACGVKVEAGEDWLTVHGGGGAAPEGGVTIETHLDHRIGMSFLVMGLAARQPVAIDAADTINTSFPHFAALMNALGARITPHSDTRAA